MKKTSFINTFTGKIFYPLEAEVGDVDIIDIAHSLSLMCRANGHYKHFYSVAQHSINCALEAENRRLSKRIQLACLMHDASEAYISDITRPVKKILTEYLEMENNLQNIIHEFLGLGDLTQEEIKAVKEIDDAMLNYEMEVLLDNYGINDLKLSREYDLSFVMMDQVESTFIEMAKSLMDKP